MHGSPDVFAVPRATIEKCTRLIPVQFPSAFGWCVPAPHADDNPARQKRVERPRETDGQDVGEGRRRRFLLSLHFAFLLRILILLPTGIYGSQIGTMNDGRYYQVPSSRMNISETRQLKCDKRMQREKRFVKAYRKHIYHISRQSKSSNPNH